jgi:hypothetical protein
MKNIGKLTWIVVAVLLAAALSGFNGQGAGTAAVSAHPVGQLTVTMTAQAGWTRTTFWSIRISAHPTSWTLAFEDQAVSRFTVRLDKIGQKVSVWTVSGVVHIENQTQSPATVTGITEIVSPWSRWVNGSCGVKLPAVLQPGQSLECPYTIKLSLPVKLLTALQRGQRLDCPSLARFSLPVSGISRVKVKTSGPVAGSNADAHFALCGSSHEVNASVHVSAGGQIYGPYTEDASFDFDRTYSCTNSGTPQVETAAIVETGQSSQATVQINCPIGPGVGYETTYHTYQDGGGWAVKGTLDIHQETIRDMWVANVRELITTDLEAAVDCGYDFSSGPYRLAPGAVLHCTFQRALPDTSERLIYARITFQISRFYPDGTRTPAGTFDIITHPDPLIFGE